MIGGRNVGIETVVTRLYTALDEGAKKVSDKLNLSYLEGLVKLGPMIVEQELPADLRKDLLPVLDPFWSGQMTKEDIRRAYQLAVLKGLKSTEQAHHHVTPDTVALFIGYLSNLFFPHQKENETTTILDVAVGSANLITAVLNQMKGLPQGIGVDVDDLMIQLALTNGNLQQTDLELFHQDAFRPLLVDPVDLVVSDLPIGYYPDHHHAASFKVVGKEGQALSHHMMIEQGLNYLKPGGYAIFVVPNQLFSEDEEKRLYQFIQEQSVILGFLQLPPSMFKKEEQGRSLLMLQKQGEGVKKPKQALLAQLPSFSNKTAFSSVLQQIQQWFKEHQQK